MLCHHFPHFTEMYSECLTTKLVYEHFSTFCLPLCCPPGRWHAPDARREEQTWTNRTHVAGQGRQGPRLWQGTLGWNRGVFIDWRNWKLLCLEMGYKQNKGTSVHAYDKVCWVCTGNKHWVGVVSSFTFMGWLLCSEMAYKTIYPLINVSEDCLWTVQNVRHFVCRKR